MNILVTGAGGFIGSALVRTLAASHRVTAAARRPGPWPRCVEIPDIENADWREALSGVEVVIHAAARVHVMKETSADPLAAFRRVNVDATLNLAKQAAAAGVRRFIFLSSIKASGERGAHAADDPPAPEDAYGLSKLEAEQALAQTGMELVILRPPLVYGPGVKGNFRTLIKLARLGLPLPLASVDNRRSFIALDNLADLISVCIIHPAAANQRFMASDGEDLSTPELFTRLARAMGKTPRLFPFPPRFLKLVAPGIAARLCGSLTADITKTRRLLHWTPPISIDEGLQKTIAGVSHPTASPEALA